jgi:hypothetical protein
MPATAATLTCCENASTAASARSGSDSNGLRSARSGERRNCLVDGRAQLAGVKRVLLTGMSGTGKSSVIEALDVMGYKAVDTDNGWCEPLPDGRQRWREDAIAELLDAEDADFLLVAGCEENQVTFHPRFDVIILLSAPAEILVRRLARRTGNPYGKSPAELARVFSDLKAVEPPAQSGRSRDPDHDPACRCGQHGAAPG